MAQSDATTVLSRGLVAKGIYPTVDPLDSTSAMLQPRIIDEEHYEIAQTVKQSLQCCKELQDVIAILGLDEISEFKSTPPPSCSGRWDALNHFMNSLAHLSFLSLFELLY